MKLDDSRSTVTSVNLTVQDRQLMVDHVFSINVSLAQEEKNILNYQNMLVWHRINQFCFYLVIVFLFDWTLSKKKELVDSFISFHLGSWFPHFLFQLDVGHGNHQPSLWHGTLVHTTHSERNGLHKTFGGKTMIFLLGMFGKRNDDMDLSWFVPFLFYWLNG